MSTSAPTFVLVHGAWHKPVPTWHLLQPLLESAGHRSIAVELPSAGPANDMRPDLHADAAAVRTVLDQLDGPAVLVGHSYGGVVISTAGRHPAVDSLVYLAAFALDEGQTVLDIAATVEPPPLIAAAIDFASDGLMSIHPSMAHAVFYADVPTPVSNAAVAALVPSTAAIFTTPQATPAWRDKPSTYVVCNQDQAIPIQREREMALHCTRTVELTASHSPFLSMPQRVSDLLLEHLLTTQ
jgi:pimeloyl-ACP methyl ester carboxylesterase